MASISDGRHAPKVNNPREKLSAVQTNTLPRYHFDRRHFQAHRLGPLRELFGARRHMLPRRDLKSFEPDR